VVVLCDQVGIQGHPVTSNLATAID